MCMSVGQHVHCLHALLQNMYEHARNLVEKFGKVSGEPSEG